MARVTVELFELFGLTAPPRQVEDGCVAIIYEHGDFQGWHSILPPGEYKTVAELENNGITADGGEGGAKDNVCPWGPEC